MCLFKAKSQIQQEILFKPIKRETIKLILLGKSGVGKTSIKNMYLKGSLYQLHETTLKSSYESKNIQTKDGQLIQVNVWDKAGDFHITPTMPLYYRYAKIALIVFDLADNNSFTALDYQLNDMRQKGQYQSILKCVVGNKSDLEDKREVTKQEGKLKASQNNCFYYECSAVSGQGINQLFEILIEEYINNVKQKN